MLKINDIVTVIADGMHKEKIGRVEKIYPAPEMANETIYLIEYSCSCMNNKGMFRESELKANKYNDLLNIGK